MFIILLRVTIIFLIVLLLIRLMGKRQIGEMQPFELVIMLIFADIATMPMADMSVPLLNAIIPLVTLVLLQFFLSFLARKSIFFRKIINGKPVVVIDPNGIIFENLKALNMTLDDLSETLRGCNVSSFDEVQYAIIETNGKASVIMKSANSPVTCDDMKLTVDESTLPILLVSDGKINKENLELAKIDIKFIEKIIKKANISNIKNVLVMTIDNSGKVYVQGKNQCCQTLNIKFNGGEEW